jgi:Uncharacterized protein with SCP/PR1 domains
MRLCLPLRLLATCAAVCALVFVSHDNAGAQVKEPSRPVARLITDNPSYTRARDANETPEPAANVLGPKLEQANPIERRAFEQTNAERAKNGLPALVWDPDLCRMARSQSERMAKQGYLSHSLDGLRLRERARAVGIAHYAILGENIAYNFGYDDPGGFAVERWMVSPGHRANILEVGFKAMAVGTFVASDGSVFLTQTFLTR